MTCFIHKLSNKKIEFATSTNMCSLLNKEVHYRQNDYIFYFFTAIGEFIMKCFIVKNIELISFKL